ncbi:MAG TPA: hypothetical protein VMZ91_13930 [Candidatus Paceibacterota bacterium]|nr:hypothetical protein [Candidatus Paceibacterota bacterium]
MRKWKLPKDRNEQLKKGRSIVRQLRTINASEIEIKRDLLMRGFNKDMADLIFATLLIDELKLLSKGKSPTILRRIKSDLELTNHCLDSINDKLDKFVKG